MACELKDYRPEPEMERFWERFSEINRIPRPTGEEAEIREHLIKLAQERGLEYRVDDRKNLAVDVPATLGKEDCPRVYLQGHMDMVTFDKDKYIPRNAVVEEGWVRAENMTLGMDDGFALAAAFALVDDRELVHGPMTLLFTVHEEKPPMGASELDPNILHEGGEAILINLDSEEGADQICIGCAASSTIEANLPVGAVELIPEGYELILLEIEGLPGGHSGMQIHEKRGNGIILINQFLEAITNAGLNFQMCSLNGGEKRNVIPSSGRAVVALEKGKQSELKEIASNLLRYWRSGEHPQLAAEHAEKIRVNIGSIDRSGYNVAVFREEFSKALRALLSDLPTGPIVYEGERVVLSNNLAVVRTNESDVSITLMTRDADEERLTKTVLDIRASLERAGATVEHTEPGGAWLESTESNAVELAKRAALAVLGASGVTFPYHAGLETPHVLRALSGRVDRVSGVSVGPLIKGAHTITEASPVASVRDAYLLVKKMIELVSEPSADNAPEGSEGTPAEDLVVRLDPRGPDALAMDLALVKELVDPFEIAAGRAQLKARILGTALGQRVEDTVRGGKIRRRWKEISGEFFGGTEQSRHELWRGFIDDLVKSGIEFRLRLIDLEDELDVQLEAMLREGTVSREDPLLKYYLGLPLEDPCRRDIFQGFIQTLSV